LLLIIVLIFIKALLLIKRYYIRNIVIPLETLLII